MAEPGTSNDCAQVIVLPRRPRPGSVRLDPRATLDLALLGALAQRTVPLDRVVDIVGCLVGDGWCLSREMVYDTLQCATRSGFVAARETWVNSVPFVYALTPAGGGRFSELMRLPLPRDATPDAGAAASVKYGLLDLVDRQEMSAVRSDLRRFYLSCRTGLETSLVLLPGHRPHLEQAIRERLAWIDRRIAVLDEQPAPPLAPAAGLAASPAS